MINYYRNIWARWSHTLAPLTRLMYIKNKFKWTQVKQDAFEKIKRIVARDNLLTYPNPNKAFKNYTNSSTFKLGVVICQKERPISFYRRRLTDAQQWYSETYRELISIKKT